ncbi:MAG: hypothetical protein WC797_02900 [Candidatus Paceibacterota bacterium]|jgi:hypothetical protein
MRKTTALVLSLFVFTFLGSLSASEPEMAATTTFGTIYHLPYRVGLRKISTLAKTAKFEDLWTYIPVAGVWADIGYDGNSMVVKVKRKLVMWTSQLETKLANSVIVEAHIHVDRNSGVTMWPPSSTDISSLAECKKWFVDELKVKDVVWVVCTPSENWILRVSPYLAERLSDKSAKGREYSKAFLDRYCSIVLKHYRRDRRGKKKEIVLKQFLREVETIGGVTVRLMKDP